MATVARVRNPDVSGTTKVVFGDVTFSNSYTTGGEPIKPSDLGFGLSIDFVDVSQASGLTVEPVYNTDGSVNLKVKLPTGGAGAPAAGAQPVPTASVPVGGTAVTSTSAQPSLTVNSGIAAEVPAGRDLSTIKVRCVFQGN